MPRYAIDLSATVALTEAVSTDIAGADEYATRALSAGSAAAGSLGTLAGVAGLVEDVTEARRASMTAAAVLGTEAVRAVRSGVLAFVQADEEMAATASSAEAPIRGRGFGPQAP